MWRDLATADMSYFFAGIAAWAAVVLLMMFRKPLFYKPWKLRHVVIIPATVLLFPFIPYFLVLMLTPLCQLVFVIQQLF